MIKSSNGILKGTPGAFESIGRRDRLLDPSGLLTKVIIYYGSSVMSLVFIIHSTPCWQRICYRND